jgi:hypothetical protein
VYAATLAAPTKAICSRPFMRWYDLSTINSSPAPFVNSISKCCRSGAVETR